MKKEEAKDISSSIIEEIDDFIEKAEKTKKILLSFVDNIDILSEDCTDEEIITIFNKIDINISDINSFLSHLLSDSKKLESFIHQIKLLKRKRDKKIKKEEDKSLDELIELLKNNPKPQINPDPWSPYYPGISTPGTGNPGTYPPYSPGTYPNTTPYTTPGTYYTLDSETNINDLFEF